MAGPGAIGSLWRLIAVQAGGAHEANLDSVKVAAAVIIREGKILICQRKAGDTHEFEWEFPGGKVERRESFAGALQRELEEELAIQARIGPEIHREEFQYPGRRPLVLAFFRVEEFYGEPVNQVFEQIVWEDPQKLPEYNFLKGDVPFIQRLAAGDFFEIRLAGANPSNGTTERAVD